MCIPKVSLGALMVTVIFAGTVLAEIRAFLAFAEGPIANVNALYFVAPLLTVGNLLAFLIALSVPEVWRTGHLRRRPFWWGFQAASWGALSAFGLMCLILNDHLIDSYLFAPQSPIILGFNALAALLPESKDVEAFLEFVFLSILFGGPCLVLGLLGGLATWALGIEVEFRFQRRGASSKTGG